MYRYWHSCSRDNVAAVAKTRSNEKSATVANLLRNAIFHYLADSQPDDQPPSCQVGRSQVPASASFPRYARAGPAEQESQSPLSPGWRCPDWITRGIAMVISLNYR